ncbi:MAG: phosphatase PAP2 family protein [Stellaceae bacterium]
MNHSEPQCAPIRPLGERLSALPRTKAASTAGLTGLFFAAYFFAQRHPFFPVTTVPAGPLDRWIGFHPDAIVIYLSLWVYVSLGVALMGDGTELFHYWAASGALAVAGVACFFAFPTAVPHGLAEWSPSSPWAFLGKDTGNACPSLHAAFALFTAAAIDPVLRETGRSKLRAVNFVWSAAIVWSTLAIKQHVIIDAIAGAALGAGAAAFYRKLRLGRRASRMTTPTPPITTA